MMRRLVHPCSLMVLFISILLGIACLWCLLKAIYPSFSRPVRASIQHHETVQPIEDYIETDVIELVEAQRQKKATVRIGLPPKPDPNHTIRISLPGSGDASSLPLSWLEAVPAPVPAPCPGTYPTPTPGGDLFQGLTLDKGISEEEFLGSTRIVIEPVVGKFYWLLGLNISAEFRGYAGMDQDFSFFHQGCLFYLDRGTHAIRLAEDQDLSNFMDNTRFETHGGDEIIKPTDSLGVSKINDEDSLAVVQRMRALTYMYEELLIENNEYQSKKAELLQEL